MTKKISNTEIRILTNRLEELAGRHVKAMEQAHELHKKRLEDAITKFNAKWLKKNMPLALSALTLRAYLNDSSDPKLRHVQLHDYRSHIFEVAEDKADKLREKYAADAAADAELRELASRIPHGSGYVSSVFFPALNTHICVPREEISQWKNVATKIDNAILDGDAKALLRIIEEYIGV